MNEFNLSTLDEEQRAVVLSSSSNILVAAGAGSGKTRVLTERIKYLLRMGIEPHNIVAFTFTNMAADEMKSRLKDVEGIGDAFVGTMHAFAHKVYHNGGYKFTMLNDQTYQLVMEEILNKPHNSALTIKRWLQYMDVEKDVKKGRKDASALSDFLYPSEKAVLYNCGDEFTAICERDNIITFEQLLEYAKEYYETLGANIEYLLVDEFQDICPDEYKFITALNANNYFFVGDDWQSIYGFKGGDVNIFNKLAKDPTFSTYYLQNNYRNASRIITLADRVIDQVQNKVDKAIVGMNPQEGLVSIAQMSNKMRIANILNNDKNNWCDWFVLTRTNREAYTLADLLDDQGVNYCFINRSEMSLEEIEEALKLNLVKIMTVHAAKGLESKKVILYGRFPLQQPSYMRNEEERKVMYVGITRAIEKLYIFN
ncbi:MAG: ATP-dependent helicase [Eubacteriales bacterium]